MAGGATWALRTVWVAAMLAAAVAVAVAAAAGDEAAPAADRPSAPAAKMLDKADPFFRKRDSPEFDAVVDRYLNGVRPKIYYGDVASPGAQPWQVSVGVSEIDAAQAHLCGGSIYNNRFIVTAAHCLINLAPGDVQIAYGSNRLSEQTPRMRVRALYLHPQFNRNPLDHDIALIELSDAMAFTDMAQPLALLDAADEATVLTPDRELSVTGWGATEEGHAVVRRLRQVSVRFVTRQRCNDPLSYNGKITDNMICAGGAHLGDACNGDSGGALVVTAPGSSPRQAGIVSAGSDCGVPGKYGIYTRMTNYKLWMAQCVADSAACR